MKRILHILLLLPLGILAQNDNGLWVRSLVKDKQVYLRWIPSDATILAQGVKRGYIIERASGKGEGISEAEMKELSYRVIDTVFPYGKNDSVWAALMQADINQAFVYECVHGELTQGKEGEIRFGLFLKACDLNVNSAKAAGLFFTEKTNSETNFIYRIRIPVEGNGRRFEKYIQVHPTVNTVLKKIRITEKHEYDKRAEFMFNSKENYTDYAGYTVERSLDSAYFSVVTPTPLVRVVTQYDKDKEVETFVDTNVINDQSYFYRVKGLTHFGTEGDPTEIIEIRPHGGFSGYIFLDSCKLVDNKKVKLQWSVSHRNDESQVSAFEVYRSTSSTHGFQKMMTLSKVDRHYTDENPIASCYYKIAAISEKSDTIWSGSGFIVTADIDPPATPTELRAEVDSLGIVRINWKPNAESDLIGYRVFRCNLLAEEFTEITTDIVTETNFQDTLSLEVLTRTAYYRVTAVDHVYNNSRPTNPVKVRRPDKIPPIPPQFLKCTHDDKFVYLNWTSTPSEDIFSIKLIRSNAGVSKTLAVFDLMGFKESFIDSFPQQETYYTYQLYVADSSGNWSESQPVSIKYFTGLRNRMDPVQCIIDREQRRVELSWSAPTGENVFSYQLFRAKKGEQMRLYKTLEPVKTSLVDRSLYPGNIYVYRIKAILINGSETEISNETEVEY